MLFKEKKKKIQNKTYANATANIITTHYSRQKQKKKQKNK